MTELLTEDMGMIADIVGREVVDELMTKLPGIEIKVPLHWTEDNPLSRLDRETADLLIHQFPGDKFYVPTRLRKADNRAEALRLHKEGFGSIEIALELRISERYVRMLLAGKALPSRVDERQMDIEDFLRRVG
ncbi:hypothetical protein SAMN04515647_1653 [Cohaesibacter sp. ES.047]|uniref:hypothetical protein n=1 Tax=Cohaesibacter sp. ES.047 TaxID=1798205 RepID=UPI000BB842E4|nr:hypothetical protein [Cohaesibacter sp. ES.047]SNY91432.1 hypothetical protein SAMN04515647_1653 [Cohaesibacter sp. ES.047]